MKIGYWILIILAILIIIAIIAGATYRLNPVPNPSPTPAPLPSITQNQVNMANLTFSPSPLTINSGETVSFINNDTVQHTVTSASFDSGILNPGQVYSYTFSQPGEYDYLCTIHPNMTGKIIVQ